MRHTCALCNILRKSDKERLLQFMGINQKKAHAEIHFDQSKLLHNETTEVQVFNQCFPENSLRGRGASCRSKNRQSVLDFCRSLFVERPEISYVPCNLCGLNVKITVGKYLSTVGVINHAYIHLKLKLYKCLYCHRSFNNRSSIIAHLHRIHHVYPAGVEHFEDKSEQYETKVMRTIEQCFSGSMEAARRKNGSSKKETTASSGEVPILTRASGSKLAVERHLWCYRLVKKYIDSDGKIKCHLCSTRIGVKLDKELYTSTALQHAHRHLQKPLYRCGLCDEQSYTYSGMVGHLKRQHALGMAKNHAFIADKYHAEILAMLSQCYGK